MNPAKLVLPALLTLASASAHAVTFNITYDSSVTSQPNAAQIEAAYATAVQTLQTLYTNPITINITVYWNGSSLGQSDTQMYGPYAYSDVTNDLHAQAKTVYAKSAVASLPSTDPVSGSHDYLIPTAEAKALGELNANDPANDGYVYFENTTWTFNPTNRAVPGASDFIAVAQHETSEVMGRIALLGQNLDGVSDYIPLDLYHFSGNHTRTFVANLSGAYFSINNGATVLKYYSTSSDPQDWLSSGQPSDSFNASLTTGQKGPLSFADLVEMDALGYNLNFTPPRVTGSHLANGNFQITFNSVPGLNFYVLATTNLTSGAWTTLGAPTESPAGHYTFTDTTTSSKTKRFYQAVLE